MVKQIIKEALEKNPIGLKEAVEAELAERLQLALEAKKKSYMEDDDCDDDEDDDDEDDDDEDDDDEDDDDEDDDDEDDDDEDEMDE